MSNSTGDSERVTFEVALRDFLEYHEVSNSSPGTMDSYRRIITSFVAWLSSSGLVYVDELRIKHLRSYVAYLQKKPSKNGYPLSDTTIHHYALVVSVFCHWMEHEELIDVSVVRNFDLPKFEEKDIPALTRDDFDKLLEACEEGDPLKPRLHKALTARNRAIVTILFDAGIRRNELVGLRLGDVDRDRRLLHIKRKGGKWQQVPVSYDGFKPLHEYITRHRPYLASLGMSVGSKKDDFVFLGSRGKPLDVAANR
jgi:site-specific recombinase XerD